MIWFQKKKLVCDFLQLSIVVVGVNVLSLHTCIKSSVRITKGHNGGGIGDVDVDDGGGGGDAVSYESVVCREDIEFSRRYIHCVLSLLGGE